MKPWSVVEEQEQWLRGSKGSRGLIPGAWARERARREIYVMRFDNRRGRRDERRDGWCRRGYSLIVHPSRSRRRPIRE